MTATEEVRSIVDGPVRELRRHADPLFRVEVPAPEAGQFEEIMRAFVMAANTMREDAPALRDDLLLGDADDEEMGRFQEAVARFAASPTYRESAREFLNQARLAGASPAPWRNELLRAADDLDDLAEEMSNWPESAYGVRITWGAYLKTCWALLWNAICHPRSTTTIDLLTGKVLSRE